MTAPMPLSQGEVTDSILDKYKYLNINIGTYVCELEHWPSDTIQYIPRSPELK